MNRLIIISLFAAAASHGAPSRDTMMDTKRTSPLIEQDNGTATSAGVAGYVVFMAGALLLLRESHAV